MVIHFWRGKITKRVFIFDQWDLETVLYRLRISTNKRVGPETHGAQVLAKGQGDEMTAAGKTHFSQTHTSQSGTDDSSLRV